VTNKYLEKIASLGGAIAAGAGSVGRVAAKGVKALGHQVHLATGGVYTTHAEKVLGVRDPYKLAERFAGKESTVVGNIWKDTRAKLGPTASKADKSNAYKKFKANTLTDLQKKQRDARLIVGGTAALGATGVVKAKSALDNKNVQTYQY